MQSFFWFVFSRIWTEYKDLRSKCPYSVQIRENADQKKTPYLGTFYAVSPMLDIYQWYRKKVAVKEAKTSRWKNLMNGFPFRKINITK